MPLPLPMAQPTRTAGLSRAVLVWPLVLCAASSSSAQSNENLAQATIEDLLNMTVTSASKKKQRLFRTQAARHREFGGYEGVLHSYVPRSLIATPAWSF